MNWDESEHPRDPDGRFTYARLWRVVSSVSQTGAGGAYFGRGRYFSTDETHARELLQGYQDFVDQDARLVTGRARVRNPFHVDATDTGETLPGEVMHRALRDAGIIRPGERLTPEQIRTRLQAAGYDSVQVHQPGPINHQVGGSQLLVFNHADSQMDDDWAAQVADRLAPPSRLQAALASGVADEQEHYQGNSGDTVTRVTFNDGTVGIRKKLNPRRVSFDRQPVELADAEQLGTAVAQALGVPTPELARTAPDEIVTVYIPSTPSGYVYWKKKTGLEVADQQGRTAPGRPHTSAEFRLAIFDLLTENHDRTNPTNLRLAEDGQLYTIDHEKLFRYEEDRGPTRPGNLGGPGPYAEMFVMGFEDPKWATNPLSKDDIAWIRQRLEAVRPQFEAAGRMQWWDGMSARLDAVAKEARGTENLL